MPDEWRWVANSPFGKLFIGVNSIGEICSLGEMGGPRKLASCGEFRSDKTYGLDAGSRDSEGRWFSFLFLFVSDGYHTVTGEGIECTVRGNSVVIMNYPTRDTSLAVIGDTTITLAMPVPKDELSPFGPSLCM